MTIKEKDRALKLTTLALKRVCRGICIWNGPKNVGCINHRCYIWKALAAAGRGK